MTKTCFVKILEPIDEYFNGELSDAIYILDMGEWKINQLMDTIIEALEIEIDPLRLAKDDVNTSDCGSYLCSWLFGETDFRTTCATPAELYDYIQMKYKEKADQEFELAREKNNP